MHSGDSKLLEIAEADSGCVENPLDGACKIGCYSVDAQERFHYNDRSHMRYYYDRNTKDLPLDLNVGYEDDIPYTHDRVKVMNNLFRWIMQSRFEPLQEKHSIHFVCMRGVIRYLLNTPYDEKAQWTMCACRLHNVIYLRIVDDHGENQSEASSEYNKRCAAWGFKFEQYMTSDSPDGIPDMTSETHQVEKFYIIVKNKIGPYNILISADIDAFDPSSSISPDSGDTSCYVEIKSCKVRRDRKSDKLFYSRKLRYWWSQAVCSGTEKIICGFRDENGMVRDIVRYNTSELPPLCDEWSPTVCMNFCYNILHFLSKRLTVNNPRIRYRCEYTGGPVVSVSREENPRGPLNLIPDWYEDELKRWASESKSN